MKYTKQDFLDLIQKISEDSSFNKVFWNCPASDHTQEEIVLKEMWGTRDKYIEYEFEDSIWGINFAKLNCDTKTVCAKSIEIRFKNQPPISIFRSSSQPIETGREYLTGYKKIFFKETEVKVTAFFFEVRMFYKLRCGNYEFDLSQEEADGIYNMILRFRKDHQQIIQDKEIESRINRYEK